MSLDSEKLEKRMGSRGEVGQGNRKHEKQLQTKAGPSNLSHTRQDRTEEIISGDVDAMVGSQTLLL